MSDSTEQTYVSSRATPIPASLFSTVLGLSGLGQAWRVAVGLWAVPAAVGEIVLLCTGLLWCALLFGYIAHVVREPARAAEEFHHPIRSDTSALLGISTMLICQAVLP